MKAIQLTKDLSLNKLRNQIIHIIVLFNVFLSYLMLTKCQDTNSTSTIFLTVEGKGNYYILSNANAFRYKDKIPDFIYVNNVSLEKDIIQYNFIETINNITIKWNQQITDCSCMFYQLNKISFIDLSYFDSSKVSNMKYMFYG